MTEQIQAMRERINGDLGKFIKIILTVIAITGYLVTIVRAFDRVEYTAIQHEKKIQQITETFEVTTQKFQDINVALEKEIIRATTIDNQVCQDNQYIKAQLDEIKKLLIGQQKR